MIRTMARIALVLAGLVALIAGTGPAGAEEPAAAASLNGQLISACKDDLRFSIVAVRGEARDQIADHPAAPGTFWVVLVADITNLGNRSDNAQPLASLRDDRGRVVEWTLFNGLDQYVETDTAAEYRVTPSWELIAPGRTVRTILIFLVESDARTLTLLPYDVACSAPATTTPVTPAPVMPPVPPAMSAPPATGDLLVGQRVTACNYNADLVITVVSVERTTTIAGELAPSGSQWIVLLIDVTNVSTKAEALTSRPLQLRDASGAVYEVQEDPPDITAVADSYGVTPPWQGFVPGITDRSVLTFLVPRNAGALTLAGKRDFCD